MRHLKNKANRGIIRRAKFRWVCLWDNVFAFEIENILLCFNTLCARYFRTTLSKIIN